MEIFGLLKGVECRLVKTDPAVLEAVHSRTGIEIEKLKEMLRYNLFTMNQFTDLTGLSRSVVEYKTQARVANGEYNSELDFCYPFRDKDGEGPKFIVRNAKSEKYLQG